MIHIFHKWAKWEDVEEGDIYDSLNPNPNKRPIGFYVIQQSLCTVCGKKRLREVRL